MSEEPDERSATLRVQHALSPTSRTGLKLRIFGEAIVEVPLPMSGDVVLGRALDATVQIDDPSVSRHHARLSIGDELLLVDLDSANGTRAGDVRLAPKNAVAIRPGAVIELGSVVVTIEQTHHERRLRRLWPHGYFEVRLEEECQRGGSFTLVRLRVFGIDEREALSRLAGALGPNDIVALYAPADYELLLRETSKHAAQKRIERLSLAGARVSTSIVSYPRDGATPELLTAAAARGFIDQDAAIETSGSDVIVAEDGPMKQIYKLVDRIAPGAISVLLLGETGVGKEVIAEAIHQRSPRRGEAFLKLNCAAFSEMLLESELFGHEKGAFTGADETRLGLLETADRGSVFLDEVGELSLSIQAKLLRVLDQRSVMRVGGRKLHAIDVRFVAATNRDLESEVIAGRFRRDLYYRLNGVSLTLPPLRERRTEIARLARRFLACASEQMKLARRELSPEALSALESYAWPGNIRELKNMMERAVLLAPGELIMLEHLPLEKMTETFAASPVVEALELDEPPRDLEGDLNRELEALERTRIIEALERCGGNQTRAAARLGISRTRLIARMNAYRIIRPRRDGG